MTGHKNGATIRIFLLDREINDELWNKNMRIMEVMQALKWGGEHEDRPEQASIGQNRPIKWEMRQ